MLKNISILFIIFSALFSASENAFFSLSQQVIDEMREDKDRASETIIYFTEHHKKLLATILIANNFVNVAIVLVSSLTFDLVFQFTEFPILGFVVQVVIVTFLLLVFGEIMPKVYAITNNLKIARLMALPLYLLFSNAISSLSDKSITCNI